MLYSKQTLGTETEDIKLIRFILSRPKINWEQIEVIARIAQSREQLKKGKA